MHSQPKISPSPLPSVDGLIARRSYGLPGQKQAIRNAWKTDFQGNTHLDILERLNDMVRLHNDDKNIPYWNVLPVLQSSGMGKSRAVDELAKYKLTLPICLRPPGEDGFPPGDAAIYDLFLYAQTNSPDEYDYKIHFLRFFRAIFDAAYSEMKVVVEESSNVTGKDLARLWYDKLMSSADSSSIYTVRNRMYGLARRKFFESKFPGSSPLPEGRGTPPRAENQGPAALKLRKVEREQIAMKESLQKLIDLLPSQSQNGSPLIIYIDEYAELGTKKIKGDYLSRTMLDFLLYGFEQCGDSLVVGILLSTKNAFSQLAPPSDVVSSGRGLVLNHDDRPPPFVHFDFDRWRGPIVKEGAPLREVCQLDKIARFGRPLWWTRITAEGGKIDEFQMGHLVQFAAQKLVCSSQLDFARAPTLTEAIAVLDVRLGLMLQPLGPSSKKLTEQLIASFMRIVYHVPEHKEFMRSGYSSEPILAEAAAQIWNNKLSYQFDPLMSLARVTEEGYLEKGDCEESVARFILIRAHDIVMSKNSITPVDSLAPYSGPTPLWEFFQSIFPQGRIDQLSSSRACNDPNSATFKTACSSKFVRFTHFASARDLSIFSTVTGWKAIARANAWKTYPQQKSVNIVIPILIAADGYETSLEPKNITFLLVQIKNRAERQNIHFSAETLKLFKGSGTKKIPYFVMVFDLGVTKPPSDSETVTMRSYKPKNSAAADPQPMGHPCYWIEAVGYTSDTFNSDIVKKEGSKHISTILSYDELMDDATPEEQKLIWTLKPDFGREKESFQWEEDISDSDTQATDTDDGSE